MYFIGAAEHCIQCEGASLRENYGIFQPKTNF